MALTLRTDDQLEDALDALVAAEGVSRQEVIRRAILDRQARRLHAGRVDASSSRLVDRWGAVLDRLGSV